jgi:carbamoyl-phosphate synthase large subunit
MVKYFKEILGNEGKVFVCNSDSNSIAFKYADEKVVSPLIYNEEYIPFLLNYCKKKSIDILISLFDIDLLILARHKKQFEEIGTNVVVSEPKIIEICNDKWQTYQFLINNNFNTPLSFLNFNEVLEKISTGELSYPIVVKPRYGCGSISVSIAYDEEELRYLTKKANKIIANSYLKYESSVSENKVIYQEYLNGQEFGADIINDLNGITQNVIIRKKLAMRSGETDIAELVDEPVIEDMLIKLGQAIKHIANMDCDIFMVNGVPFVLEMNARFGGGYPFSHMGGCNLPKAIVEWVKGNKVDKSTISAKTGIIGFKEIYITEM